MKVKLFLTIFLVFSIVVLVQCEQKEGNIEPIENITPLENSWDIAVPNQEIPNGLTSLSAESCGACHQAHYEEWKYSTHSHAWTDLQFQAELKKETSPFMCINCHIPLQNQQEYIIEGLIDGDYYKPKKIKNPHFDKALQQEGINCAACHVRNNVIIGPTGTAKAPHETVKDTLHLSEQLCISCHNAIAEINDNLVCTFETGDEWKAGPYVGQKNCINCHMDTITRSVVPGFDRRLSHRHYFPGSGIPKVKGAKTKMLNGLVFYPSKLKSFYKVNDSLNFTFKVANENAGHKVPTADPERFIITQFTLTNTFGDTLMVQTERIGEKWEWHPKAKKIGENNLLPGDFLIYNLGYKIDKKTDLILNVQVTKHRMSQASADYNGLGEEYPISVEIYNQNFDIKIH